MNGMRKKLSESSRDLTERERERQPTAPQHNQQAD